MEHKKESAPPTKPYLRKNLPFYGFGTSVEIRFLSTLSPAVIPSHGRRVPPVFIECWDGNDEVMA